ncbi:MAG: hypothetical protein V4754_13870 [Pseudomonadota bacterium]
MPAIHETYTRQQGHGKTYDIEYTSLRYRIALDGKVLKEIELPIERASAGSDASWRAAIADIEHLRGMSET